MSAAAQTKLFGLRIPVDPKVLFGVLAAIIALLFWYNSRSDDVPTGATTSAARTNGAPSPIPAPVRVRTPVSRRAVSMSDRGVLRLRPIDPSKGDIDPTLRLDLLARLQSLQPVSAGRSLFEGGGGALGGPGVTVVPVHAPTLIPKPRPDSGPGSLAGAAASGPPPVNIPFKYYGYVKPSAAAGAKAVASTPGSNRGFFLDGDNVMVAAEGELLKQRYLVVELTPTSARMEDTQIRQGQTLPVVAAATP